uniref:Uncharacterized protein n=1 Tax=Rhizophora mucronata TaxID=61149 RepID=A0A2P2PL08_RHIMU
MLGMTLPFCHMIQDIQIDIIAQKTELLSLIEFPFIFRLLFYYNQPTVRQPPPALTALDTIL